MNPAYDMYFRDGFAIVTLYDIQHLLLGQFPAFVTMGVNPGIRAEITGEDTNIGGFDMEIAVEIRLVAVFPFPHMIGERSQQGKAALFE
jgi:hypothetical protein